MRCVNRIVVSTDAGTNAKRNMKVKGNPMKATNNKKDWFKKTISAVVIFGMAGIAAAESTDTEAVVDNTSAQFDQGVSILETATSSAELFEAKSLIISAANAGNPRAQLFMGMLSVKDSEHAALPWFQKAADQGNAVAQVKVGDLLSKGEHIARDIDLAATYHRKAADQQHRGAMKELAKYYETPGSRWQNVTWSANWYRRAARAGDLEAAVRTGDNYASGQGLEHSRSEAFSWYQKAAFSKSVPAFVKVAECYENGFGAPQDLREATGWYEKAARAGHAQAQFKVAQAFLNGVGVEPNKVKAYTWLKKAAGQGVGVAELHTLTAELSDTERAEAERQVAQTTNTDVQLSMLQ